MRCWPSGVSTLADVEERLAALAAVRPTEDFEPLAASFKRIRNILEAGGFRRMTRPLDRQPLLEAGPESDLDDRLCVASCQ